MEVFIRIGRPQENSLVEERTAPEPDTPSSTTTPPSVTDVGSGESSTVASSVSGPLATNRRTNQVAVTGGKGAFTQWAHGEFMVSYEAICPPNTHWAHAEYF